MMAHAPARSVSRSMARALLGRFRCVLLQISTTRSSRRHTAAAVWRRLLRVVEIWSRTHLNRPSKALAMLRETLLAGA